MYKLCKTEQSAARQRELEHGLMEAMKTCRYEEISVSDLCQKLGTPRKAFYRYFSGKEGALHALLDHTMMDYEQFAEGDLRERTLEGEMERFFLFWKQNCTLLEALDRSDLFGVLVERAVAYAMSGTALPRRFLAGRQKWEQKQVVGFTLCGLMCMMISWCREGFQVSAGDMGRMAAKLVTQPLFPAG